MAAYQQVHWVQTIRFARVYGAASSLAGDEIQRPKLALRVGLTIDVIYDQVDRLGRV